MGLKIMEVYRAIYDSGYGEWIAHSSGAETGDYSHIVPWIALAVISLGAIVAQVVLLCFGKNKKKKKREDNER